MFFLVSSRLRHRVSSPLKIVDYYELTTIANEAIGSPTEPSVKPRIHKILCVYIPHHICRFFLFSDVAAVQTEPTFFQTAAAVVVFFYFLRGNTKKV